MRLPLASCRPLLAAAILAAGWNLGSASRVQAAPSLVDPVFGGAGLGLLHAVNQLAVQPDGKLLVAGGISNLVRLNTDGTVDFTFHTLVNGSVQCVAVQPDGKILIAGGFARIDGALAPGYYLNRLHPDGTVDESFFFSGDTDEYAGFEALTLVLQSDGKILVGGFAENVFGTRLTGIIRLDPYGAVDTTFQPSIDLAPASGNPNCVYTVLVQSDQKILIGGNFTKVNGVARDGFARLNADGTLDTAYAPAVSGGAISPGSLQPDGKLLVVGSPVANGQTGASTLLRLNDDGTPDATFNYAGPSFASYFDYTFEVLINPVTAEPDGQSVVFAGATLFRVNADGSQDDTFHVTADNYGIVSILPQTDGTIFLGGEFSEVDGQATDGVAKLNADGTLDASFSLAANSGPNAEIFSMAEQADGKVVISGLFTQLDGVTHNHLARLNDDGTPDAIFNASTDNTTIFAGQPDGKLVLGGYFTHVNGIACAGIARVNTDGSLDTTFDAKLLPDLSTLPQIALQADGKILYGADFGTAMNLPSGLYRLNADGSIDSTFQANLDGRAAHSLAVQSDGRILVGGFLSSSGEAYTAFLLRLNTDGSLDPSFNPSFTGVDYDQSEAGVEALVVQADGKILAGGDFTTVNGLPIRNLVRLNPDGSLDASFQSAAGVSVGAMAFDTAGRLLVSGDRYNGIFVLSADGSVSPFVPGGIDVNGTVKALVPQTDGKILVGGLFSRIGGAMRNFVARLTSNGTPDFFAGWLPVGNGFDYLQFPDGTPFGFYTMLGNGINFPYFYHVDLGMEYFVDAQDGQGGAYLYDFASNTFFYTSPTFPWPYLYDFSLDTVLYYYPDPNNPGRYNTNGTRYFYDFASGAVITK